VTAALVRARATAPAGSGLAHATIVARDPRTRAISRFPDPGPSVASVAAALPWEQLLGGIATSVEEPVTNDSLDSRLAHVGTAIASHLPEELAIGWWRPGNWPLLPMACEYLVLTVADRLILLVLPDADAENGLAGHLAIQADVTAANRARKEAATAMRHRAIQADVAAAYQFGEAAVTVLVSPWANDDQRNALLDPPTKPWWNRQLVSGARPGLAIDLAIPTAGGAGEITWRTDEQIWRQLSRVRTVLAPWVREDA
jgi:hypothetical protein